MNVKIWPRSKKETGGQAWNQNLSKLYQTGSNDTWIRRGLNNSGGDNGRKRTDRK